MSHTDTKEKKDEPNYLLIAGGFVLVCIAVVVYLSTTGSVV